MIDIHPEPQNSTVELWRDGHIHSMGALHESRTINKVLATRPMRATSIKQGLFTIEMETTFDFCYHFDSFAEWAAHLEERNWGDSELDAPMISDVQAYLDEHGGKVVIREAVYAACLRRLAPR